MHWILIFLVLIFHLFFPFERNGTIIGSYEEPNGGVVYVTCGGGGHPVLGAGLFQQNTDIRYPTLSIT